MAKETHLGHLPLKSTALANANMALAFDSRIQHSANAKAGSRMKDESKKKGGSTPSTAELASQAKTTQTKTPRPKTKTQKSKET